MTDKTGTIDSYHLADIAGQYYVAARFSASTGAVPVGANLMHYAFEFLLKAFLVKRQYDGQDAETIEKALKKYYHHLDKLWPAVTSLEPALDEKRFTDAILSLDPWWDVRYPGSGGAVMVYVFFPPLQIGRGRGTASGSPRLELDMRALDECFHRVWAVAFDPLLLTGLYQHKASWRAAYEDKNSSNFKLES